jgi:26S proteasome regulatory subunit N6
MILCKVLNDTANEVPAFLSSKIGMKHSGIEVEAMEAVAKAATNKSLEAFQAAVSKYADHFKSDHLISHNLERLFGKMLEGNLLKIILPYSVVEIAYVATSINLPIEQVERKLSQMILDHKFAGILDQGKGELIVYEDSAENMSYTRGVDIIGNIGSVVDALTSRATKLSKGTV